MENDIEEYLDIIDENDKIIGRDSYDEVHRKNLRHRVIHVMISNANGELLLQMRSKEKKAYPLHWSMSVGGHVSSGETYEQAAMREMQEEVGIQIPIAPTIREDFTKIRMDTKVRSKPSQLSIMVYSLSNMKK